MDRRHISLAVAGAGLDLIMVALRQLLPEKISANISWIIFIVGGIALLWGMSPIIRGSLQTSSSVDENQPVHERLLVGLTLSAAMVALYLFSHWLATTIPISVSLIKDVDYQHRGGFDEKYELDTPAFEIKNVFISNLAARQVALNIFLHVASDKIKDLSIYGDGRDIWGKIKGTNDWASSIVKRNIADPPKYMNSPIILKPLETVHGTLFFVVPFGPHTEKQHDPMFRVHADLFDDALHHRLRFRLAIKDEVSGATVNIPVPGEYKGE